MSNGVILRIKDQDLCGRLGMAPSGTQEITLETIILAIDLTILTYHMCIQPRLYVFSLLMFIIE